MVAKDGHITLRMCTSVAGQTMLILMSGRVVEGESQPRSHVYYRERRVKK